MVLDLKKIDSGLSKGDQIEPRKLFTTLNRAARFKRPSDEQSDVLDAWFTKRTRPNNTLKMNTGAGKTLVGLLALQSSANEGVYPCVYITPDKYLVNQVTKEASDLGIRTTVSELDPAFVSGKAILVINIKKLINGLSVFGVGSEGTKIKISSLVVDDAHACLVSVAEQFSIRLQSDHPAYALLLETFKADLRRQSASGILDIEAGDPRALMAVPFWAWMDSQEKVMSVLHPLRREEGLLFSWNLLKDVLELCQCVFGGTGLEIAPRMIPADVIPAFVGARRRIYMTATLSDDSILVSHFQADPQEAGDSIGPRGGGDIGDRMILTPQEINPELTTEDLKALLVDYSLKRNVVVIVPSDRRAGFWAPVANQILKAGNIEEGIDRLKTGHVGLTVLVNKYDGIDLPGAACEVLALDGVPEVNGLIERLEHAILDGTAQQLRLHVQRIEQGMGRGVRSSEDYCVVLLLGSRLTQRIHVPEARTMFSRATKAQLDLGREVTEQIKGGSIDEIRDVIDLCLRRDEAWVKTSRSAVVNAPEPESKPVDPIAVHLRQAFDAARSQRSDLAVTATQFAINQTQDDRAKGYLKQQLAEFTHGRNPALAQEIQLAAIQLNRSLVKPLAGVTYRKLIPPAKGQAAQVARVMERFQHGNDLVIWWNAMHEDLAWGEDGTSAFERAIRDLGELLGFGSQRPEYEIKEGPDNLWATGELRYFVIECKSGVGTERISKHDCNQLNGSIVWFGNAYDQSCTATPVLVHRSIRPEPAATLSPGTRILDGNGLESLKGAVSGFVTALASGNRYLDSKEVTGQLAHFRLSSGAFLEAFTTRPRDG